MLLAVRVLFLLGLVMPLHGSRRGQVVPVQVERRTGQKMRLMLETNLQPPITSMSASPIAHMSLTPWTYTESNVESRFPRQIFHASCLTSGCLSLQGEGEDMNLEAKPIYYQILVLHRIPRKGRNSKKGRSKGGRRAAENKYAFRLGTEIIPVGCTCVRPSTVPQE